MDRIFIVVGRLFESIFTAENSVLYRIIVNITETAYLQFTFIFVIIGFAVGILSRIIHSN